jgi:hypothetical protein
MDIRDARRSFLVSPVVDTLLAQHLRRREVTDYVLAVTVSQIDTSAAGPLARALDDFA